MGEVKAEYICSCFYSKNIFIKKYKLHVSYLNDSQFDNEYRQFLRYKGCSTDYQYNEVLQEVHQDIALRKSYHQHFFQNYLHIERNYRRLHPDIWTFQTSFLDPRFVKISEKAKRETKKSLLSYILHIGGDITEAEVFKMPLLTCSICCKLIQEIENFDKFPCEKTRPNTMNKYGISLDEMGWSQHFIIPLVTDYLQYICAALFPEWGGGAIDSFKSFIVKYKSDEEKELSKHFDNSEITMNISLNCDFDGGDLQFYSMNDVNNTSIKLSHQEGHGIIHNGRQYHSALPLTSGIRYNLIIWLRSSSIRNKKCPMCNQAPDMIQVPTAGDGFIKIEQKCNLL